MNCEFCGKSSEIIKDSGYPPIEAAGIVFHPECFRLASRILAKNQPKPKVKVMPESPPEFMVIMNPSETLRSAPREHYKTYNQALAVAKRLAGDTGKSFWVMKHIASVDLV